MCACQDDDEEEEGWEDDGDCDEEDDVGVLYTSDLLQNEAIADLVDDDDYDPDAAADPLNSVALQPYLTNFICTFAQHPAYAVFTPHLNPHEKEVLTTIGVQHS